MKHLLVWAFAFSSAIPGAIAQSAVVSNTADAGAGSLRAAFASANAAGAGPFTITIAAGATTGPIVVASLLPSLQKADVTITAAPGAGRLVVDARGPTATSGFALELAGDRIDLLAPCSVLVQQGHGIVVRGTGTHLADVEATGNLGGAGLVALATANDLVVGRLLADRFVTGIHLMNCSRARIADDGVSTADLRNSSGVGILIDGGTNHTIGSFVCTLDEVGVLATASTGLLLGKSGAPRSLVAFCRQQGILLQNCPAAVVTNLDTLVNGTAAGGHGLQMIGGAGCVVTDVRAEGNRSGGLSVGGGASNLRVGPAVSTRGLAGLQDVGITVRAANAVSIVDCQFGPDHHMGALLQAEPAGTPTNVTLCRCTIVGNRLTGMLVQQAIDPLVCASTITGNLGDGIQALPPSLLNGARSVEIAGCRLGNNAGHGLLAQYVDGLTIGPGDRIDDNIRSGVQVYACNNAVVESAVSMHRNRDSGIWFVDCTNAAIARSALWNNRGAGILAVRCTGLVVGPENEVRDTLGTGVQIENSAGCRVTSTRVQGSSAYGVHVLTSFGAPAASPHVLQSCLIADQPGIGLIQSNGPPVICQLCTIAGNLRGVNCNASPLTLDSCIVYANLLEDIQQTATAVTIGNTFHAVPAPAPGSSNTSLNPQFVSPAAKDWRLQPTSPAVGYANAQSIVVPPGSLDAFAGPRVAGTLDAGAYEVGPHPAASARLSLSSPTMANGGGGLAFHARYPTTAAGTVSLLLLQIGPPSGSFVAFGTVIPLTASPALFLATDDPRAVATIAVVPADGIVDGALLWAGKLPPTIQNQVISLCAVAVAGAPSIAAVSNVATFTIQ